jgi:rhodanese-related sulfurtransferase
LFIVRTITGNRPSTDQEITSMTITPSAARTDTTAPDAPTPASGAFRLRPSEVRTLLETEPGTRIIDVRTAGEFESAHITGAYNVPLDTLGEHRREIASLAAPVVLVCQSGARAAKADDTLRAAGMTNIRILEGGMNAWMSAGETVTTVKERWGLERQVRLVAGSIVLAAIVVSIWVPAARFVAGLIGAGLTFAALSNTCAMGMLLAKLPYNQGATCDINEVVRRLRTDVAADPAA